MTETRTTSSWRKHGWKWLALVALGLVGTYFLRPRPLSVAVATVRRGTYEEWIEDDGRTQVRQRYRVTAPLSGMLQRVSLRAGDAVDQAEVLAVITPLVSPLLDARTQREMQERVGAAAAQLQQARAVAQKARSARLFAKSEVERTGSLVRSGAITARELDRAELDLRTSTNDEQASVLAADAAEHDLQVARAALQQFGEWRGQGAKAAHWQVRAPAAGRVLRLLRDSEGFVAVGELLMEIGDPGQLEVVVDVLSADAVRAAVGALVQLERWGGAQVLSGRVRRVEPAAFTKVSPLGVEEQRVRVIVDLWSPKVMQLGDGFEVRVRIRVGQHAGVLVVPESALFRVGGAWAAYVLRQGRVGRRIVAIDRSNGIDAMVRAGLRVGDQVVLHPDESLKEGSRAVAR